MAKAKVARIAAGGTVGGILGGLIAERTGAILSVAAMLLVLALLHLVCAVLSFQFRSAKTGTTDRPEKSRSSQMLSGFKVLSAAPYLKNLSWLVLLGSVAEALFDYALKTQATAVYGRGDELIRFFGFFYTGVSLLTFLVQSAFGKLALQQLGLAGTISTMPFVVVLSGLGSLISPSLNWISLARGGQSVFRSSLFRSGYELLYAPVSRDEKRAAKTIIDVGFDRFGDALGGALIRIALAFGFASAVNIRFLIALAVLLGAGSLVVTRRLGLGYVRTLEKSLLEQGAELDLLDIDEEITRATILRTLSSFGPLRLTSSERVESAAGSSPDAPALHPQPDAQTDPRIQQIVDLQARDASVVRNALSRDGPLDPLLIAPVIRLIARDDVSEDALRALRRVARMAVGQLTDALLNPDEDFAVRRRVPRVLASYASRRTVDGLLEGLRDSRFEVRFSCGRALSKVCSIDETLRPEPNTIYAAALDEIRNAERLSEAPRMLDHYEEPPDSASENMWDSTDIRLEHIFRLLSLCLPREPLHVAFQALHTDNSYLRGTALEYLESVLPTGVREHLWQFLEGPRITSTAARPTEVVLDDLMKSRHLLEARRGAHAAREHGDWS
jgi:AAA family ATP:ADP antiporter